tara:strand:- start:634 stop:801 length:168 start_codon:yes stop_codon:yes gene_type:complete
LPGFEDKNFHVEYLDVEESMKKIKDGKTEITNDDKYAHFHEELYQRRGWDEYENQ